MHAWAKAADNSLWSLVQADITPVLFAVKSDFQVTDCYSTYIGFSKSVTENTNRTVARPQNFVDTPKTLYNQSEFKNATWLIRVASDRPNVAKPINSLGSEFRMTERKEPNFGLPILS